MGPAQLCPKGLSELAQSSGELISPSLPAQVSSMWLGLTPESDPHNLYCLLLHGPSLSVLLRSSLHPSCAYMPSARTLN